MTILSSLLMFCVFETHLAWNSEGHRIVSRIAVEFMARKTSRFIRDHLVDEISPSPFKISRALAQASVWADTVADELPWSAELHFINTPERNCSPFDLERDCGIGGSGRCLVTAIANYTMRASDITLPFESRVEAIKFLSHFVADAHQPLHGGFAEDFGGNAISLGFPEVSLHELWDTNLVTSLKQSMAVDGDYAWYNAANRMVESLREDDNKRLSFQIPFLSDSTALQSASWMLSETVTQHTCNSAYKNEHGRWIASHDTLSDEYLTSRTSVVYYQLMKSGIRLAQIMDAVANKYFFEEHRLASQAALLEKQSESSNQFEVLELDFFIDIEESVFELPIAEDAEETELLQIMSEPEKLDSKQSEASHNVEIAISPEEKKREQNRKKKLRKKVNKRKMFGIDVESLVLIKRNRKFYITYENLVVSDTFVPERFMIIEARFQGMAESEPSMPFYFDWEVFATRTPHPAELFHAIFRKIGGLEYSVTSTQLTTFSLVSASDNGLGEECQSLNPQLQSLGFAPISYDPITLSTVSDFVRPIPSESVLRSQYKGELPSEKQRIFDTIVSQGPQIVCFGFGNIFLLSTAAYLMDNSNGRWVFSRELRVNIAESSSKSYWVYVDARVLNDELTGDAWEEVNRLSTLAPSRKLLRDVVKRGSRIIDRLVLLSAPVGNNPHTKAQIAGAFRSIRTAFDSPCDRDYVEFIMRPPAEEKRILESLRVPPIRKMSLAGFYPPK